jgi:phosphoglucosamine mutase
MTLRFGTDGVRGAANVDLTPELVVSLGRAAARVLGPGPYVLGRDPRESGPMLEAALIAGLSAGGASVSTLGIVPTPAVAWASAHGNVPGAMISASHNPYGDNGIKLFAAGGRKLTDAEQQRLEDELDRVHAGDVTAPGSSDAVGTVAATPEHLLAWADSVAGSIEGRSLEGLRLVVDCANGAASAIAPHVLERLGAELVVVNNRPDGRNINDACGSTDPADVQRLVVEHGADAGIAFDGDADRVLAVDEHGLLVDGDQIMVMTALDWHARGTLRDDAIVVTVMSNLGLHRALGSAGVGIVQTPVGDRHVTAAMAERNLGIGGEQSGHIVFADLATTGDGLLTGLLVADLVARRGVPLSQLAAQMTRLPQVLVNVRPADSVEVDDEPVRAAITAVERELGDRGRVVVRASGTEKVVRVMVEAPTEAEAADAAARVRAALEA